MKLFIQNHQFRPGVKLYEIQDDDGNTLATIVPVHNQMFRIVSAHITDVLAEPTPPGMPRAVAICLREHPNKKKEGSDG